MHISKVSLPVRTVEQWITFFTNVLELPRAPASEARAVLVGETVLEFRDVAEQDGDHHLAILIPDSKFRQAKAWIGARATILAQGGDDEFECSPAWNAHSVYFDGPDDSVLELIARRDLRPSAAGAFTRDDLLALSEVGVAVPSVTESASELSDNAGIHPYGANPSDTFAPVGSIDGLIILVSQRRTWFPTSTRTAVASEIRIEARGARPGRYSLGATTLVITD